jgi:hypothetical protein
MALLLKHQTGEQFIARLRDAYRNSERERLVQIAKWLLARIQAGDVTDAQCRTAFGLNVTQWNNLKTKMANAVTAYNTVQAAQGE